MASEFSGPLTAYIKDTSDGHGAQFELLIENANEIPQDIIKAISHEKAIYVDGMKVRGTSLVISFCRGSLLLAQVDGRWNRNRKDEKFRVIKREEMDYEDPPDQTENPTFQLNSLLPENSVKQIGAG